MDDDFAVFKQGSDVVLCRHRNVVRLVQRQILMQFDVALDDAGFARQAGAQIVHTQYPWRLVYGCFDAADVGIGQGSVHEHVEGFAAYAYGAPAYPQRQAYADDGVGLVPTIQAHAQRDEHRNVAEDVGKVMQSVGRHGAGMGLLQYPLLKGDQGNGDYKRGQHHRKHDRRDVQFTGVAYAVYGVEQ